MSSNYDNTYNLVTRTVDDCERPFAQSPISAIQVGDIMVQGIGTLNWRFNEVVEVENVMGNFGPLTHVTCASGRVVSDTPNGFWRTVIKRDRAATERAHALQTSFAKAWDRKH